MKKIKLINYLLILTVFASSSIFAGGGNRNGTAGATQLLIPVGARGVAMSGASLVGAKGLEALYWNPANLVRGDNNTSVLFSQMNYIADIGVTYGAVSANIEGFGALALSIKSLEIGEIPVTTTTNPDGTGQNYTPSFVTIGVTYSKMLSDRISFGLTGNFISERLDLVSTTGIAFNVGIAYQNLANVNGLSFAIVLKNIGPTMKYDGSGLNINAVAPDLTRPQQLYKVDSAPFELPSTLELGFGYEYALNEVNSVQLNGVFQNSNFYGDEYKIGAEYSYDNLFFVRGGYMLMPELEKESNIYGLTAGVGLNYNLGGVAFKFDYAFRQTDIFDDNHVFTVQFGF